MSCLVEHYQGRSGSSSSLGNIIFASVHYPPVLQVTIGDVRPYLQAASCGKSFFKDQHACPAHDSAHRQRPSIVGLSSLRRPPGPNRLRSILPWLAPSDCKGCSPSCIAALPGAGSSGDCSHAAGDHPAPNAGQGRLVKPMQLVHTWQRAVDPWAPFQLPWRPKNSRTLDASRFLDSAGMILYGFVLVASLCLEVATHQSVFKTMCQPSKAI